MPLVMDEPTPKPTELTPFAAALKQVLSVSKEELQARIEAEKQSKRAPKKSAKGGPQ